MLALIWMSVAMAETRVQEATPPEPVERVYLATGCQAARLPATPKPSAATSVRYTAHALDRIPGLRVPDRAPPLRDAMGAWAAGPPGLQRVGSGAPAVPRPLGVPTRLTLW